MPPVLNGSFPDVVVNPASKISEGLKNSFNSMVISLQPESKAPGGKQMPLARGVGQSFSARFRTLWPRMHAESK